VRAIVLIFVLLSSNVFANEPDDVDSLSKRIEVGLSVGMSKQEVESFLKRTAWSYTYDRFANRYQAMPANDTAKCKGRNFLLWLLYDCVLQIFINLDDTGNYSGYTVEQTYTGL
jgi:hypothetical protein